MDNTQVIELLHNLSKRVSDLEKAIGLKEVKKESTSASLDKEVVHRTGLESSTSLSSKKNEITEIHSSNWLGYVGILFFILGGVFFVKLAIDSGWLTPFRQLALVVMFAVFLISIAFKTKENDSSYSALLAASGLILLFLSSYAGHLYFQLYETFTAILIMFVLSLFSIQLFYSFKNDFFLGASIIGSYSLPVLLEVSNNNFYLLGAYLFFWNILFSVYAILLNRRLMIALSAYFSLLVFQINIGTAIENNYLNTLFAIIFQAVQFVFFVLATTFYSIKNNKPLLRKEAFYLLPVLYLFYIFEFFMIESIWNSVAPFMSFSFSLLILGAYFVVKNRLKKDSLESSQALFLFVVSCLLHVFYIELLPVELSPWFGIVLLGLIPILNKNILPYQSFFLCYYLFFLVIGVEYFNIIQIYESAPSISLICLSFIYFLAFAAIYLSNPNKGFYSVILYAGYLQCLLSLDSISQLFSNFVFSGDSSSVKFITSSLWSMLALVSIFIGSKLKDKLLSKCGVYLFGFISLKILLFDIEESNGFIKVLSFIIIGMLLYSGGYILRKINKWENNS